MYIYDGHLCHVTQKPTYKVWLKWPGVLEKSKIIIWKAQGVPQ